MARRTRQQFQFTTFEMAALGGSFFITACLVFILGFYVGRGNSRDHGPASDKIARIPVDSEFSKAKMLTLLDPAAGDEAKQVPTRPKVVASTEASAPGTAGASAYSVQVLATRRSADADQMARSLKASGYDAYVKRVEDADGSWYRVRIGRMKDLAEARELAEKCRDDLGLDQAYVSPY